MWTPFKEKNAERVLEHLNEKKFFTDSMDRYSVTKLLNVFWVRQLAQHVKHRDGGKGIQMFDRLIGRTREEGGRLLMDAAFVKGETTHGQYISEARVREYVYLETAIDKERC